MSLSYVPWEPLENAMAKTQVQFLNIPNATELMAFGTLCIRNIRKIIRLCSSLLD